jgi:DNA-binding transcriptional LysR family regulator
MRLRQLEILRAVIRFETTMAAARSLGMSQPAVSNAIRLMESQLGFPLFERINNRLFPTDAARLIYDEAEPLFAIHAALADRVQDLRDEKVSRLRILSTPPLGHGVIPLVLDSFLRRHRRLRTFFDVRDLNEVIKGVESGSADIGFGLSLGAHPTLVSEVLAEGRMVCVCRRDNPIARLAVATPADLARTAFVALNGSTRMGAAVREAFRAAGQSFNFSVEVRYCHSACLMVAAGLGVSVVDRFSAEPPSHDGLAVIPFEPEIPSIAYAFWSNRKPLGDMARRFVGAMRLALDSPEPAMDLVHG